MERAMQFMRRAGPPVVSVALLVTLVWPARVTVRALDPSTEPRVMQWDLTYLGGFRLPDGTSDAQSFDYGGTALAYNPANNSLFLVGNDQDQLVAEINIPTPVISATQTLTDLPITTLVQPFGDVLAGQINAIGPGTAKIGGLLPYGSQMIVSAYLYYDAENTQTASHFIGSTNLNSGSVNGPYTVSNSLGLAGFVSGWMAATPTEWQSLLGGPYLTGQCCLAIISRTSLGPSVTVFDPANLGSVSPVPGTTVLGYPISNPTLGTWSSNSTVFNGTTTVAGMVFPPGTRAVLFFGRQGTGPFCYGDGTADQSLVGTPAPDGSGPYCYDPTSASKGVHGYPYVHQVWAYDANDLAAVKAGTKNPWDVQPYATWTFTLPYQNAGALTGGVAYDPATQRLFIADQGAETIGYDFRPVIHVFQLTAGSPEPATPPPAPIEPPSSSSSACAITTPYVNAQGTQVCVNGRWLATTQVSVTATVELLPLSHSVSIWALVGEGGVVYTPLKALPTACRSKGTSVTMSGTLRPDVRSPLAGAVTIDLVDLVLS